jgi:predicted DNA-binding transcriptional regulator YafY
MYHPTTRVLTVLELLQSHGSLGGPELASRLEVEPRTVRRYIAMLQDMGIPITATRGPGGRYRLRPGFKLPPLMFSNEEALAITFSLMTSRRQATSAAPHILESVLAKIERVLPDSLRSEIQSLQSAVTFVPQPSVAHAPNEMTIFLSSAVQQQRCVQMRYRSKHEETERVLDPYGVVLHWDFWYVVGWCHLRQDLRVFRLDRILGVKLQKNTFKRPSDFNSLEYVLESLAKAPNSWAVEILLETTLKEAQRLIAPGVAVFEETTGGVLLRGQVERLEALARLMLTWECPLIVRQPQELRDALRTVASEALAFASREF